uniref:Uncharacterized protein n=1 Tax=Rhizophora mucronata TaxID=61149 RepID=A0A2P2N8G1_RHIMU
MFAIISLLIPILCKLIIDFEPPSISGINPFS